MLVVSGDESSTISPSSVLDALDQDVPWMQQVTLDAVQASPTVEGELTYPDDARAAELPDTYLRGLVGLSAAGRAPAPRSSAEPADPTGAAMPT